MIALYLHHSEDDTLLYVGTSADVFSKQVLHQRQAPWFNLVKKISIVRFKTMDEARKAGDTIIQSQMPVYNRAGNQSIYTKHLIRLHTGDFARLGKFYSKPNKAIRELIRNYINSFPGER